ncbi:MAG TPA: hypothetical protein VNW92_19285, partial [Polyangiaceae bacterium]|nr:hypothetical protein [Polyangiaceae bacterium]
MTERRSAADLGSAAEAALGAFPFPEQDWEQSARAVESKLSGLVRGSTDASLLAPPLPAQPGEPGEPNAPATTTPLTNSGVRPQSLADIARRSVEQKQSAERELLRASLALAAQSRANGDEVAAVREAVRAVPAPPPSANANPARDAKAAPVSSASVQVTPSAQSAWPKLGLAAAGLALAAALLFWFRTPAPAPLVTATLETAAPGAAQGQAPLSPTPAAGADRAGVAAAAPAAIDPSTLSREGAGKPAEIAHAKSAASGPAVALPAASAAAAFPSPEKVVLEDDQPSAAAPAAPAAEKALPPDPALRPAESTGGAMPVKPSTGAVQAALGAVMSGARHCVAGDEAASSAV